VLVVGDRRPAYPGSDSVRGESSAGSWLASERLIARERELGVLFEALDSARVGANAVVLEGEAGVGKTVLWRQVVEVAPERGWRVLASAPASSEARLSYAVLGDLLDRELDGVLAGLPDPQRAALEVALLRREGDARSGGFDERLIGVAALSALRALAARGPLVVAIDDLQWVDPSSAATLSFALRRLRDEPVLVTATSRLDTPPGGTFELERMLGADRVRRLRVVPFSLGGVHELLLARLGLDASRPTLVRLQELTGGNALFALEIGRELIARGGEPTPDEPLPVPGSMRELVRVHLERLQPRTRALLLGAAALARPTRSLLGRFDEEADAALDEAAAAGVLELAGERVRFAHPLFASIHYEQAPLAARRDAHARLSRIVGDEEERVRHLALATAGVDGRVAAQLDEVARSAGLRGATRAAAELSDLAARLAPTDTQRCGRMLAAAEYHRQAGSLVQAGDRARETLRLAGDSETRARALAVLGTVAGDIDGIQAGISLYHRALRERGISRALRADLHHQLAWLCLVGADAVGAERHARAMLRLARGGGLPAEAAAAATLSHVTVVRGRPVPRRMLKRAMTLNAAISRERPWAWSETSPAMLEGVALLWAGELEQARAPLEEMHRAATEQADPWLEMHTLAYLSSLETGLGRPSRGWELAHRYLELATIAGQAPQRSAALWPLAVAACWLGRTEEAIEAADDGLALAKGSGHGLYTIGHLSVLGAVRLALGDPAAAAASLLPAWEIAQKGGIESPARFPLLADAVEALVSIGDVDRAASLSREHARIAQALHRPWARALAARCTALVADARGDEADADAAFQEALAEHASQNRPLEQARTLYAHGAFLRRRRHKRAARGALEQALAIFEAAEAEQWTKRTRAELGRIGGRRAAAAGTLSATEAAIARLVTSGRTNQEVAAELHLSARTVEWNLSKLYRRLGVRSRTELAGAVGAITNGPHPAHSLDPGRPGRGKSGDSPG
jgi:DNA-binding NarL/FixJ family response regulator